MTERSADHFDLSGRVAVVTGAGGGIGRATALALAEAGSAVVCADHVADTAEETAAAVRSQGGDAHALACDVRASAEVEAVADAALHRYGRLDTWANVAGVMREQKVVDLTEDELDLVLGVNLKGVLFGSQAAARRMIDAGRGGAIVNVASAIIDSPQPRMAAYGMSKAAVSQLTRTLAMEVGKHGIRVNVVAPGWTLTGMTAAGRDQATLDQTSDMQARFTPLRRTAVPEDAARAIVFLASDTGSFFTGQTLRPHGGITQPW